MMSLGAVHRKEIPGQQRTTDVTAEDSLVLDAEFVYGLTQGFEYYAVAAARAEFMRFTGNIP